MLKGSTSANGYILVYALDVLGGTYTKRNYTTELWATWMLRAMNNLCTS